MSQVEFRQATAQDLTSILQHVRRENLDEIAMVGMSLGEVLDYSFGHSVESFIGVIDGDPVCAFGVVATPLPGVGQPWMIGSNLIDKHGTAFLRGSKAVIADLMKRWPYLVNVADPRNTRGLRWLRFMGFTIHPAEPLGEKGILYHRFEKAAICAQA